VTDSTLDAPDHVVCVVVDCLRADRVHDPSGDPPMPFLASLATGTAVTTAPWTFPAVSSLVTGRYPNEHGAMRTDDDGDHGTGDGIDLPATVEGPTLLSALADAGYETCGMFGLVMPFLALAGRFHESDVRRDSDAPTILDAHRDWLGKRLDDAGARTFSYLHLGDLHEPVDPPTRHRDRFDVDRSIEGLDRWRFEDGVDPFAGDGAGSEEARWYATHRERLYDAAAASVDDALATHHGALVDLLAANGAGAGDLALVVTADHGEAFWELPELDAERFHDPRPAHSIGHGATPYEAVARVPVAATDPALVPDGPASLVDLAPTLLDHLGSPDTLATTGGSWHRDPAPDRTLLVEATRYGHERKAVYRGDSKLLVSRGDDVELGFRLPEETVTDLDDGTRAELRAALPPFPDERDDGGDGTQSVSGEVAERLEHLGYR